MIWHDGNLTNTVDYFHCFQATGCENRWQSLLAQGYEMWLDFDKTQLQIQAR